MWPPGIETQIAMQRVPYRVGGVAIESSSSRIRRDGGVEKREKEVEVARARARRQVPAQSSPARPASHPQAAVGLQGSNSARQRTRQGGIVGV